jgi:hypothetical protein
LENTTIKRMISGTKFETILQFLHVALFTHQPSWNDPEYNPNYKLKEMMDIYLQDREKRSAADTSKSIGKVLTAAKHVKEAV